MPNIYGHLKVITVLLCGQVLNLVIPFSTRLTRAIIPVDGKNCLLLDRHYGLM